MVIMWTCSRIKWKKRSSQLFTQLILVVVKRKPGKIQGLNGNQTHDLCDAGAVLYQMSYQANW